MLVLKTKFRECGKKVIFSPADRFTYDTILLGDYVFIGSGAIFLASESEIKVGNKVMFGPRVIIMGGNHNTSKVGSYMYDVKEKRGFDDLPVIIEDDVWVGAGATLLKGVTVGEGSIIGAGSVVTNSIPPYSIAVGVPAKVIKKRFSSIEIIQHKEMLGIR